MPADCSSRVALPSNTAPPTATPPVGNVDRNDERTARSATGGATGTPSAPTVYAAFDHNSSSFHAASPISWVGAFCSRASEIAMSSLRAALPASSGSRSSADSSAADPAPPSTRPWLHSNAVSGDTTA